MGIRVLTNKRATQTPVMQPGSKNFLDGRCGFWADVIAVNSENNSVDVIADIGVTYRNIPVSSQEWVNADENKDYVTAQRYLPPIGARVFVLTPSHTIEGAFVLCSGYVRGETATHTLYAKNSNEVDDKNNTAERITQGGWKVTEDYNNGNKNFVSQDEKIKIAVNTTKNTQKSQNKEVAITAWNTEIHITDQGLEIKLPANAKCDLTAANGDINISAGGSGKVNLTADLGQLNIGNTTAKLGEMVSDMLDLLSGLNTISTAPAISGVNVASVVLPTDQATIGSLKTKWHSVFGGSAV